MPTINDIERFSFAIADRFHPQRIILFGSHAWGNPSQDSDVDILVVMSYAGKSWRMASKIREETKPAFPLDIIVRTEDQVSERLRVHDTFMTDIISRGKVIYEA